MTASKKEYKISAFSIQYKGKHSVR